MSSSKFYFIQITNHNSDLSNELATILTTKYGCKAILLQTKPNENSRNTLTPTAAGISTIYCNPLDYAELKQFNELIESKYGSIDIIIDNGISISSNEITQNCDTFVDYTSERLRATLNVSHFFIQFYYDRSSCSLLWHISLDRAEATTKKDRFNSHIIL